MKPIRRILVTTDFSDTSKQAVGPAVDLARKFGAKLILAHIEEAQLPALVIEYASVGLEEIQRRQVERAADLLAGFERDQLGDDIEVERVVRAGTPHVEIVRLAEERDIDLIVMATHGRGFISHALLGSTTERVLRRAPCPVFVIRDRVVD